MKLIRTWIQLNPKDRKEVIAVHSYVDGFGKAYTTQKAFDSFATPEIALREMKNTLDGQASNCLEQYDGVKL